MHGLLLAIFCLFSKFELHSITSFKDRMVAPKFNKSPLTYPYDARASKFRVFDKVPEVSTLIFGDTRIPSVPKTSLICSAVYVSCWLVEHMEWFGVVMGRSISPFDRAHTSSY